MSERDKLHSTELYLPMDDSIMAEQILCMEKLYDYNQTRPLEGEKRAAMLKDMFAEIGENCWIEPPLHANWADTTHILEKIFTQIIILQWWMTLTFTLVTTQCSDQM